MIETYLIHSLTIHCSMTFRTFARVDQGSRKRQLASQLLMLHADTVHVPVHCEVLIRRFG